MKQKVAIITGVSGQDGSYLAKFLLKKDYAVIGTVRRQQNGAIDNLKYLGIEDKVVIEDLDLLDFSNVMQIIQKYMPNEIYNLAAQSSVGLSFSQPIGTFTFNTMSVNNLLESIRIIDKKIKLYQASSSEMFGQTKSLPITVNTAMHPISPYATSKMAAHFMSMNYREAYGMFVGIGILFNHESVLRSDGFFIKKVITESIAIKHGKQKELKVGNLNIKRDFGYAPKYVEAMWKIMQMKIPDDFIICSGESILLKDIVEYIFGKLNISTNFISVDEKLIRPNEIYEIYGDNSKAKDMLKWESNVSFFDVIDNLILEEEKRFKYNNGDVVAKD